MDKISLYKSDQTNLRFISRLRDDANLNYLYTGKQKSGRGRPKQYDGKVDMNTIDKRRFKKTYSDSEIKYMEPGCIVYL